MAAPTGTHLEKNPFTEAMHISVPVSAEITKFIRDALNAPSVTDPKIIALQAYFNPKDDATAALASLQKADLIGKIAATGEVVTTVAGTKIAVKAIFKGIGNVYDEGTPTYNRLLTGGATSFYKGSRSKRLIRMNALITAIGSDATLDAPKAIAVAFAAALGGTTTTQTVGKATVSTNSADIKALIDDSAEGVWYVYLVLMAVYIKNPAKALAFLPMEFIYKMANQITHTLLVPAHIVKKICIHTFKTGEMVTITNNRTVPIKVGLALNAKATVLVWFTILGGETKTIRPDELGNILYKYIMAGNDDLLIAGDITFTINAAA